MNDISDDRKPWEKKAQRAVKWGSGAAMVVAMIAVLVLDLEPRAMRLVMGVVVAMSGFASMAVFSFPGSTGFLRQPISPFPRFAFGLGLMLTGAGIALFGTGGPLAIPAIIFGPIFIMVGAGEFWRRGRMRAPEVPA